ncbi:hypothetical protein FZW96_21175 [Bacillus sp. BGMRC 2118]|nr:hypothetical protein FZW96_21175 [Bacillus sp. BGMRC 2118]
MIERMVFIRYTIIISTLFIFLTGCQSNLGYVAKGNALENPVNIEAMNEFVKKVNENDRAKITVLRDGIEGQRGEEVLTFNGKEINVHRTIDEEFIEEFNCTDIQLDEKEEGTIVYTLQDCSGEKMNPAMDFPILSVKE